MSRPTHTGIFDVEISLNGIDFVSTGSTFEYLALSTMDMAVPFPQAQPSIQFIQPAFVPAGTNKLIRVFGLQFMPGAECWIGNSVALQSIVVTSSEMHCVMPVHIPGVDFLTVVNPGNDIAGDNISLISMIFEITFVQPAALHMEAGAGVTPHFGPRDAYTVITIHGMNFDLAALDSDGLLCLIGDDWVFADEITTSSLKCTAPPNAVSGKVNVKVSTMDKEFLPGTALFNYIDDPLIFDAMPKRGSFNTEILIYGRGFMRMPELTCAVGSTYITTTVINDKEVLCTVPAMEAGEYSVTLSTNGQHHLRTGVDFEYFEQIALTGIWPFNGPALKGSTIVTIYGQGFQNVVDIKMPIRFPDKRGSSILG